MYLKNMENIVCILQKLFYFIISFSHTYLCERLKHIVVYGLANLYCNIVCELHKL